MGEIGLWLVCSMGEFKGWVVGLECEHYELGWCSFWNMGWYVNGFVGTGFENQLIV